MPRPRPYATSIPRIDSRYIASLGGRKGKRGIHLWLKGRSADVPADVPAEGSVLEDHIKGRQN